MKYSGANCLILVDELKLIVLAAHPPDDVTGVPVDFCYLCQPQRRDQQLVVVIDLDGIDVNGVEKGLGQVLVRIGELIMIPTAPLENNIFIGIQFLNDGTGHHGARDGRRVRPDSYPRAEGHR